MTQTKQLKFFLSSKPAFFRLDEDWKKLSVDKLSAWGLRLILLSWLFLVFLTALYYRRLPAKIPLFYSRPWGLDQLADKSYLFVMMAVLSVFTLINLGLAFKNRTSNLLLAKMAVWLTVTLYFMAVVDIVKIFTIISVW